MMKLILWILLLPSDLLLETSQEDIQLSALLWAVTVSQEFREKCLRNIRKYLVPEMYQDTGSRGVWQTQNCNTQDWS